jgi:hypothetical protein
MRFLPLLLAAGCGRIGFTSTELSPGDGATADGASERQPLQQGCNLTHPKALLCDGFEAVDDAWDYQVEEFGAVIRSEERGAQGNASLKIEIDGVDQYKAARWGKNNVLDFLATGGLHIREYIFMPSRTVVADQLSIMVTGNQVDPFPSANVLLTPGEIHAVVEATNAVAPFEFPRDRWVCVELHLQIDGFGAIALEIDGSTVVSAQSIDTRVDGGYTNIDVGFHYATPTQPASEMFVDEIVADTSPIGCD